VRAVLISVGSSISPEQLSLFNELVDANEPGVAIDMLTEALAGSHAEISQTEFEDIKSLAEMMRIDSNIADRIRPRAT
jgi:hypothetical protein